MLRYQVELIRINGGRLYDDLAVSECFLKGLAIKHTAIKELFKLVKKYMHIIWNYLPVIIQFVQSPRLMKLIALPLIFVNHSYKITIFNLS